MALIHEVPTHLGVEDTLTFGLTPRQLLRLSVAATLAYSVWDQTSVLPAELRDGLAAVLVAFGLLLAVVQPAGRPLDQWILAAFLFLTLPRRRLWRLEETEFLHARAPGAGDWAELSPEPEWIGIDGDPQHAARVDSPTVRSLDRRRRP